MLLPKIVRMAILTIFPLLSCAASFIVVVDPGYTIMLFFAKSACFSLSSLPYGHLANNHTVKRGKIVIESHRSWATVSAEYLRTTIGRFKKGIHYSLFLKKQIYAASSEPDKVNEVPASYKPKKESYRESKPKI